MNREQIIEMAKEAGFGTYTLEAFEEFERFAAIVAAAEREECAKVCESFAVYGKHIRGLGKIKTPTLNAMFKCAAAIRARGQQ